MEERVGIAAVYTIDHFIELRLAPGEGVGQGALARSWLPCDNHNSIFFELLGNLVDITLINVLQRGDA